MALPWEHDDAVRSQTIRTRIVKVDDEKSQQRVDLKARKNEKPKKIWRPMDFGFTSVPPEDTDGVLVQMGGRSDRSLYFDGGHEKYRPKKTPEGSAALFNMHGDIIRQFEKSQDHVHQKKINIRIGKGYDAGNSEAPEGETDDKSDEDEKTISIVMDGDSIVISYEGAKVTWSEDELKLEKGSSTTVMTDSKITHTTQHCVVIADRVDLGDEGGSPVGLCSGGCATKVFAV
jgi:phage gp45-like